MICVNQWETHNKQAVSHQRNARGAFFSLPGGTLLGTTVKVQCTERDFAVYSTRNTTNCVWSKLVKFTENNEAIKFQGGKSSLLTGFVSSKRYELFAIDIDSKSLSFCNGTPFAALFQSVCVSF